MTVADLEIRLSELTSAEKVRVLRTLLFDLTDTWPAIEKTPGVSGGEACIVRTRIPVWALEGYRRLGWNEAEILENYPTLRASDLAQAWAYVSARRAEIDKAILTNEDA
jgi:uncharacterized protein (DUF433 family)